MSAPVRNGQPVCVTGLGLSGTAAAEALVRLGAAVTVVDARDGDAEQARAQALRLLGARVRLGPAAVAAPPAGTELVVTSPGWRPDAPLLAAAAGAGLPVWGEPELAWRLRGPDAGPWLALTGTNGKTTTVGMLASILTAAGYRTVAAGNVGLPLVAAVTAPEPYDLLAVELSSFQLAWSPSVNPLAAAVLNVADDHTDWHGSAERYALAKQGIWGSADAALTRTGPGWLVRGGTVRRPQQALGVGNADDPVVAAMLAAAHVRRRVEFTLRADPTGRYGISDGCLVAPDGTELAAAAEVHPPGPHNLANALAAAGLAAAVGVPAAAVRRGLVEYRPGGHRNELIARVGGVAFVDDSKATNPHAAAASLAGYPDVVWIAGGLLKGADVTGLVTEQAGRLRAAVLIGRDRSALRSALARHAPQVPVSEVTSTDTGAMGAAVRTAAGLARPGDTVLLAPAAASMDLFRDYAERGRLFAQAVRDLPGAELPGAELPGAEPTGTEPA